MRKPTRAVLFLLASSACTITSPDESGDGGAGDAGSSVCAGPSGQYLLSYQETAGNCGLLSPQYLVFDGTKQALSAGCAGDFTSSAGGCHDSYNLRCPSTGQQSDWSGTYDWTSDGKSAQGSLTRTVVTLSTDAAGNVTPTSTVCTSAYTVTLVKT